MDEFKVYRCNPWNDEIANDLVAVFYDLSLAEGFVDYQATLGNHYAIFMQGKRL